MSEIHPFSLLMRRLVSNKHRGLLVLSGSQAWCHSRAAEVLSAVDADHSSYWVSQHEPQCGLAIRHLRPNKIKHLLGSDVAHLVVDGWQGFSPDGLALASGALCAGGWLILLVPELEGWNRFEDPDYLRFTALRPSAYRMNGYFIDRCCRFFQSLGVTQGNYWSAQTLMMIAESDCPRSFDLPTSLAGNALTQLRDTDLYIPTADQQKVISSMHDLSRLSSAVLLLEADRGRGKSVALGLAIQSLLTSTQLTVAVVSPLASNVANLFAAIDAAAPFDASRLSYHAIDELLYRDNERSKSNDSDITCYDLLVIDEAAAIPLSVLYELSQLAPRVVFSTTLNGYEGSGRGFALRFKEDLSCQFEQVLALNLHHAIRWSNDDPLEDFLNQLLILDTNSVNFSDTKPSVEAQYQVREVTAKQLLFDECLLKQVFTLLMQAHYQSRPSDLRQLLDAPYLKLWVLERGEQLDRSVVGVLLCCEEGGFDQDDDLLGLIASGQRRPQGNLLSQSLAQRSGQTAWCHYRSLRVMRIAIDLDHRRKGLASQLIETMEAYLAKHQYHYWGTSFGFHSDLLRFWRRFNIDVVNLGLHRDKASGLRNLQLIKPMTDKLIESSKQASQYFSSDLMSYKKNYISDISDADIDSLIALEQDLLPAESFSYSIRDKKQVKRFIDTEISFDQAYPSLRRFVYNRQNLESRNKYFRSNENHFYLNGCADLTVFAVCHAPHWRAIAEQFGLSGRREVIQAIKTELIQQTRSK
jgi:tRNA(Met) cytidine acetyltransferase